MAFAKRVVSAEPKGGVCLGGVALLSMACWLGLGPVAEAQTPPQPPAQATPAAPATDPNKDAPKPDAPKPDAPKPDAPKQDSKPSAGQSDSTPNTKPSKDATAKKDEKPNPQAKDPKPDSKKGSDKSGESTGTSFTTEMPKNLNDQPEFIIGPGDGLMINVWKETEVSAGVVVRGDCRITLNLIKDVEVCGMTPTQIQNLLTDKLSAFIAAPDVTVTLSGLQSRKIYFIGQVRRPGAMVLNGPMTIAQALSDAGGLADYANDKKVIIQREENGKQVYRTFNYRDYLKGKNPKGNILLQPGDTIIVR